MKVWTMRQGADARYAQIKHDGGLFSVRLGAVGKPSEGLRAYADSLRREAERKISQAELAERGALVFEEMGL